ncbi:MAG: hypothetical protein R2751_00045 [Bacteroidales bacterium]
MEKQGKIQEKLRALKARVWNRDKLSRESRAFARTYAAKTKNLIREGMEILGEEAGETEQMARSFFRLLEQRLNLNERSEPPTEEEVRAAVEQLKDVGRFSVFATLVILPGGVVSLLGLELLARKFGIRGFNLIPSSFRDRLEKKKKKPDLPPGDNLPAKNPSGHPPGRPSRFEG